MLGYTREELIGQRPQLYDCDLNFDRSLSLFQRLAGGNTVVFESRHRRKDGKILPVEVRLRPIPFDGRNTALALIRDLSESREAQWHREDRDRLWNHSPDLLLIAGSHGAIKQVNPAWQRLLGWSNDDLYGQNLLDLVHQDDAAIVQSHLAQLVQTGSVDETAAP